MAEDKNTFPIINLEEKHIKFESLCVNSSSGIIKNLEFKLASFERHTLICSSGIYFFSMHNLAILWRCALQILLHSHRLLWIVPLSSKKPGKYLLTWLNYISWVSSSVYTNSIRILQNGVNFLFLSRAKSSLTDLISWYSDHFAVCCSKDWKVPCKIIIASVHSASAFKSVWWHLSRFWNNRESKAELEDSPSTVSATGEQEK